MAIVARKAVTLQRAITDALAKLREQPGDQGLAIALEVCRKLEQMDRQAAARDVRGHGQKPHLRFAFS